MSDPLSVVAGVVGILAFGLQTCQQVIEYYSSVRGSRDDVHALCISAEALSGKLVLIKNIIDKSGMDSPSANAVCVQLQSCKAGLERLEKKIKKVKNTKGDRGVRAIYLSIQYPFREKTIAKLQTIITQELDQLALALASLNL